MRIILCRRGGAVANCDQQVMVRYDDEWSSEEVGMLSGYNIDNREHLLFDVAVDKGSDWKLFMIFCKIKQQN